MSLKTNKIISEREGLYKSELEKLRNDVGELRININHF